MGSIKYGNNVSIVGLQYGDTPVKSVYLGSTLVWGQEAPVAEDSISLSTNSLTFSANDQTSQSVTVTASGTWTHSSTSAWVDCSVSGNTVTISCSPYSGSDYRTAGITFYCGNASTILSIRQNAGAYITLSETSPMQFSANGESRTVTINSSSNWTCTKESTDTWVSCSSMSGSNNDTITITCQGNNSARDRSTILNFSCDGASAGLGINQNAGLTPDPGNLFEG